MLGAVDSPYGYAKNELMQSYDGPGRKKMLVMPADHVAHKSAVFFLSHLTPIALLTRLHHCAIVIKISG